MIFCCWFEYFETHHCYSFKLIMRWGWEYQPLSLPVGHSRRKSQVWDPGCLGWKTIAVFDVLTYQTKLSNSWEKNNWGIRLAFIRHTQRHRYGSSASGNYNECLLYISSPTWLNEPFQNKLLNPRTLQISSLYNMLILLCVRKIVWFAF